MDWVARAKAKAEIDEDSEGKVTVAGQTRIKSAAVVAKERQSSRRHRRHHGVQGELVSVVYNHGCDSPAYVYAGHPQS
jgi:hypothetical protein